MPEDSQKQPFRFEGLWNKLGKKLESQATLPSQENFDRMQREIFNKYGISLVHGGSGDYLDHNVIATSVDIIHASVEAQIIRHELTKYPPEYIKGCGITHIVLAGSLQYKGEEIGGLATKSIIFIAVEPYDEQWNAQVLHHEIEHEADFAYSQTTSGSDKSQYDQDWEEIVKKHGVTYAGEDWRNITTDGFARGYGAKNMKEDQATTMEQLMVATREIQSRCDQDKHLADRVRLQINELQKRSPGRDWHAFFNRLATLTAKQEEETENFWTS